MTENNEVRLDKWLWAARFYKTRSIAKAMIEGGKVHYNGQRAKVSKNVEIGAQLLYQETAQSVKKREEMAWARKNNALSMPHPDRRPNKKERRDLLKFKHQDEF